MQARSACLACIQAALPLLGGAHAAVQARAQASLQGMAASDKDPALRAQAARALQSPPFTLPADGPAPMQE